MSRIFDTIVLAGGGTKGIIELGVLHYYYEKNACNDVKIYSGVSIGAVINLLLICGYTPLDIFNYVSLQDAFFDRNDLQSVKNIISELGLLSMENFQKKVEDLVREKLGEIPTLKELYDKTGKTLIVTVSNVTSMKPEYFSYKTHPFMDCVRVVIMSCNLPFIFKQISYGGNLYVDGGLQDNFPVEYTLNFVKELEFKNESKTLAIVISGSDTSLSEKTFPGYVYRLIFMPINTITELRSKINDKDVTVINIKWDGPSITQISEVPENKQLEMFSLGFQETEKYEEQLEIIILKKADKSKKILSQQKNKKTTIKHRIV